MVEGSVRIISDFLAKRVAKNVQGTRGMNRSLARFTILFGVYASLSTPAYAYLDPATGSIIIQSVIGIVATWVMYSKIFAAKAKSFFMRLGKGRSAQDAE
jgi:hypothetical protein